MYSIFHAVLVKKKCVLLQFYVFYSNLSNNKLGGQCLFAGLQYSTALHWTIPSTVQYSHRQGAAPLAKCPKYDLQYIVCAAHYSTAGGDKVHCIAFPPPAIHPTFLVPKELANCWQLLKIFKSITERLIYILYNITSSI